MPLATWLIPVLLTALPIASGARALSAQPDRVDALLARVADYLDTYDAKFSGVVSEEQYAQVARRHTAVTARRVLRSDVILVNGGPIGWLSFRDVFEVDGRPVRDRDDRLYQMFLNPASDALEQATKVVDEGARFNVGPISRTINVPTMALAFVRQSAQARSVFGWNGEAKVDGVPTVVLRFREMVSPRLIHTVDQVPATGRLWIEPKTGRVVRTQLEVDSIDARVEITVTYAPQEKLKDLWVPVRMEERYSIAATQSITGTATYTNFRQFNVNVATIIK
ncbi:MAG: hypothetical protein HQ485_08145 [Acidobacteria bacterium]|jgi:hypothetical protein|nr:hypothetical protein [Acidobacteriota bacterium]